MDAALSAPIYVLEGNVDVEQLTGEPGKGWARIECASKKAYGCGEYVQEAVGGLAVYLRLGAAPLVTSSLAIRMTDKAVRAFSSEQVNLGAPSEESSKMYALGRVLMAEQGIIVIVLSFHHPSSSSDLSYLVVYDDIDASLSMVRYLPDRHVAASALNPVPRRTVGGACELLFTACQLPAGLLAPRNNLPPVLCVFSPEANPSCPWQIKKRRFPTGKIREPFIADSVFSFQDRGFWADLAQGIVYCVLHTTSRPAVDFRFIELPRGCQLNLEQTLMLRDDPKNLTRTIGCVKDSIWFVCIDHTNDSAHDLVTMWTLKLPEMQWKKEAQISAREIWGLDSFKEAGLPEVRLEFPILTADGALCLVLNEKQPSFFLGHICSIDVFNKKVLWHGSVHDYPFIKPVILPANFFQGSTNRKFSYQGPAAGLASLGV